MGFSCTERRRRKCMSGKLIETYDHDILLIRPDMRD